MIIVLIGASGSGKSLIEKELAEKHGYEKIVSYTTRKPRQGEVNGIDYHFISNEQFENALQQDLFAEYDEYSQKRLYGTVKSDYLSKGNKVIVLTPNGYRQIKSQKYINDDVFAVLVTSNLGTRIKRYIDRCGVDKFTFDDKNEYARFKFSSWQDNILSCAMKFNKVPERKSWSNTKLSGLQYTVIIPEILISLPQ